MSSDLGVPALTVHPVDWMWYREFGGSVAVPPAVRSRNRRIARRALVKAVGLAVLAAAAVAGSSLVSAHGGLHWTAAALLASAAVAGFGMSAASVARRAATARRRNRTAATRAARADRIHGTPGGAAPSSASRAPLPAVRPARATAPLLEMLLALPGPEVFHGLALPRTDGTVDHAVACGDAVFLLDSVHLGSGAWEWGPDGRDVAHRTDRSGGARPLHLHEAADELRCILGPDVEVIPIVVVHGARTASGRTSLSPHGVHLLTVTAALERIGNTCAYGFAGMANRPELKETLSSLLVSA